MLLGLCLLTPARAGHYSGPQYSDGALTSGGTTQPYVLQSDGTWGAHTDANFSASGQITAVFSWVRDYPEDDPPQSVVVSETGGATAGGDSVGINPQVDCAADDGLGDTPQTDSSYQDYGSYADQHKNTSSGGTHYKVVSPEADGSVTLHCTPTASLTRSGSPLFGGSGGGGVSYSASLSPVTIQLTGTIKDSDGNENILVGQHCSAQLLGIPSACTVTYQWSVSGPTFQSWAVSPDQTHTTEVDGPGDLTLAQPGWYWNEIGKNISKQETVSCTATVTPPAGQGSAFTVTATKQVMVLRPAWTAFGTEGNMQVVPQIAGGGLHYWLQATGALVPSGGTAGMVIQATVSSPNLDLFGDGSLALAQIIIPGLDYWTLNGEYSTHWTWWLNGQEGLDNTYPYPWNTGAPSYTASDGPYLDLTATDAASAQVEDQFEDYLMYFAPGSAQCVPLAHFVWSTNGNATIPSTGNWADFSGSAGTVSPSSATPFIRTNGFPIWTQIISAGTGQF